MVVLARSQAICSQNPGGAQVLRNEPLIITGTDFVGSWWYARLGMFLDKKLDRLQVTFVHQGDDGDHREYNMTLVRPSEDKLATFGLREVCTWNPMKKVKCRAWEFECQAQILGLSYEGWVRIKVVLHEESISMQLNQSYGTVCFLTPAERAAVQFPHDGPFQAGGHQAA